MTVLLVGSVAQSGQSVLERELAGAIPVETVMLTDPDKDAVAAKFAEARMIVSPAYRADFPPSPKLEMLHAPNAGLDSIDFDALPAGVRVCNAFEHDIGIGEYVLAGMLRSVIDIDERSRKFKDGFNWEDTPRLGAATRGELYGKTLLCIGYGTIGQAVAARARPFGVRIEAVTRTPRPIAPEPDKMAGYDSMKQMIADADFVLIACPLNDETEAMFDAELIGAMKSTAPEAPPYGFPWQPPRRAPRGRPHPAAPPARPVAGRPQTGFPYDGTSPPPLPQRRARAAG